MSKKVTALPPKLFIGMDIHKKSWKIHCSTDITIGAGKAMPPSSEGLFNYIQKHYPKHQVAIAYEAGCCGFEPARDFIDFGWDTFVVNPADIPRPAKMLVTKTDKIDAKNIALQLRSGHLKKITIPSIERECLRSLTRQRSTLVRASRRIKSQIKSHLLYYHITIPEKFDNPNWSKDFIKWIQEIPWNFNTVDFSTKSMIQQYHFIDTQIKEVSNFIRAHCRKAHTKDFKLLQSVPGIGALTAAYIIAEIGDLRRFNSFKKLASFIGFTPSIYNSGDSQKATGTTPRANRTVRSMIVEASWVAIRFDPVIQQYYRSHQGKDAKAAIFKVGRKLLSRIHGVIKSETPYQKGLIK